MELELAQAVVLDLAGVYGGQFLPDWLAVVDHNQTALQSGQQVKCLHGPVGKVHGHRLQENADAG